MTADCKQIPQDVRCVVLYCPEHGEFRVNVWFTLNGQKYGAWKGLRRDMRLEPQDTVRQVIEWVYGEGVRLNAEPLPIQDAVYRALKQYLVGGWPRSEAKPKEQIDNLDAETRAALAELYSEELYRDVAHGEEIRREAKEQFRKFKT